ncbi:MAG: DUF2250 domain-containing protein [candidate division Zixibacteria bacterium]|nr:DUF2250 domain-containing protein [candidate division Zixibacteria bacterium]
MSLREGYSLAGCCSPVKGDAISGYYSHNQVMIVHRQDCPNLAKVVPSRVVALAWDDIMPEESFTPDADYHDLDELDWRILGHHQAMGVDYSLVVARTLHASRDDVFSRHRRLRSLKLLKRVEPLMMQYRKGIVKNKWIKHRNHTYYELTPKGIDYLEYHQERKK